MFGFFVFWVFFLFVLFVVFFLIQKAENNDMENREEFPMADAITVLQTKMTLDE